MLQNLYVGVSWSPRLPVSWYCKVPAWLHKNVESLQARSYYLLFVPYAFFLFSSFLLYLAIFAGLPDSVKLFIEKLLLSRGKLLLLSIRDWKVSEPHLALKFRGVLSWDPIGGCVQAAAKNSLQQESPFICLGKHWTLLFTLLSQTLSKSPINLDLKDWLKPWGRKQLPPPDLFAWVSVILLILARNSSLPLLALQCP